MKLSGTHPWFLQIVKLGNEASNATVSSNDVDSSKTIRYEVMILYKRATTKHEMYNFLDIFMVKPNGGLMATC